MTEDAIASFAKKFELILSLFPHPDRAELDDPNRRRWKGIEISEATDGRVSPSYLSGLKSGRIKRPGLEQLYQISAVMDFPFELWLEDETTWEALLGRSRRPREAVPPGAPGPTLAERVERLFASFPDRRTGEPYTNRQVAAASGGRLSERDLERLRAGEELDPSRAQLLALSDVFDVEYAYWLRPEGPETPVPAELLARLGEDEKAMLLSQKAVGLSEGQKDFLLLLAEQFVAREHHPPGSSGEDEDAVT